MAIERGLPSLPRTLDRELRIYLQSLGDMVLRLAGNVRGADASRALRVSEGSGTGVTKAVVGQGEIVTRHLADASITSKKLADNSVCAEKLAQSAVTERAVAAGAVTRACLAAGAVSTDKIFPGVLPVAIGGTALPGDVVIVPGRWKSAPQIVLVQVHALMEPSVGDEAPPVAGAVLCGPRDVQEVPGAPRRWQFIAVGGFTWAAWGYAENGGA